MPAWTDDTAVLRALGASSAAATDPYLTDCVTAANSLAFTKRVEAGYEDDPLDNAVAPNGAVALGTTQLAVDLYRARGSTDTFASYAELDSFAQTFGNWSLIRRLLGIGRAQVDRSLVPTPTLWRRGVWR